MYLLLSLSPPRSFENGAVGFFVSSVRVCVRARTRAAPVPHPPGTYSPAVSGFAPFDFLGFCSSYMRNGSLSFFSSPLTEDTKGKQRGERIIFVFRTVFFSSHPVAFGGLSASLRVPFVFVCRPFFFTFVHRHVQPTDLGLNVTSWGKYACGDEM